MKMTIFALMVRRLAAMTDIELEHAQTNGYVTINISDNGTDPLGWWAPTRITVEMLEAALRQRSFAH
jgi:hypothetical protein